MLIVGGVAATAVIVLVAVVLLGSSHRDRSDTATVAASSDSVTAGVTTTFDPAVPAWMQGGSVPSTTPSSSVATTDLGRQYLAIVEPANQALYAYMAACGCPDHPTVAAARAAIPALSDAQEREVNQLLALSQVAPEPAAGDLRALVVAKSPFIEDLRRIMAMPASASDAEVAPDLHALALDEPYGQAEARRVRADLGLPAN